MFDSTPASAFRLPTALTVARIDEENYRTKTIVLNGALEAMPGQFVMAWLPRFDEKPFSLVDNDPITLMVTAVGPFSRLIHALEPGDQLWLRGPFGQGFAVPHGQARLALIGGGYGVAPLLWLARSLARTGRTVTTIIGARTAADLLYAERFAALARFRPPHATAYDLMTATEDGSRGVHGRVTDALLPLLNAGAVDGIYACGPDPMLAALRELGRRYAVPCQLSWEAYMRCAIGICGACEHEGKVLCLDGPVVRDEKREMRNEK